LPDEDKSSGDVNMKDAMKKKIFRKWIIVLFLLLSFPVMLTGKMDQYSEAYIDEAFQQSFITFAIARTLNGIVSVAQGTHLGIEPPMVSVNLAVGEILDPINDLIEQFSWVMLASTASLGMQKILMQMGHSTAFTYFIIVTASFLVILSFWQKLFEKRVIQKVLGVVLILIIARFSMALIALGSEVVYENYLKTDYQQSYTGLEASRERIKQINGMMTNPLPEDRDESVMESAKKMLNAVGENINVNRLMREYEVEAERTATNIINMIIVFVMQTIVFPLLFLVLIYISMKITWKTMFMRNPEIDA